MPKTFMLVIASFIFLMGNPVLSQDVDDATAKFNAADTDANGTLPETEFKTYVTAKLPEFKQFGPLMERLDADKDGLISKEEFDNRRTVTQQLKEEAANSPESPVEFADGFNLRYAGRKPQVGDTLGDLVAFDEHGNELDFESLKGKYTVFNFGCLT